MLGKIDQFFYPFEELKQVVVAGNDLAQNNLVVSRIREGIINQSGALGSICHLVSGVENKHTPEEFLYLYNRYADAGCIKFALKTEEVVYSRLRADLLIINISFSSILPQEHDESDKYELGEWVKRSADYDFPRLYLLNINRTLLNDDYPTNIICRKLQEFVTIGNFKKAGDILNEKGIRQLTNVHNYLISYFPFYSKPERIQEDVQVIYFEEKSSNDEAPWLSLYIKLLNLDTTAKSTINRY